MSQGASAASAHGVTGATYAPFLGSLSFLAGISTEEVAAFAQTTLVRDFSPGTEIITQGQYGNALFVLVAGTVAVSIIGDNGSVEVGRIEKQGDFFGEAALLGRGERTATVKATTPVIAIEIEKHRFDLFARRHKGVREQLEAVYHARAIATYTRTHRYFSQLPDADRKTLFAKATLKLFTRGDTAVKKGDKATSVIIVKDGVLKAMRTRSDGSQSILAYFNNDDVVGAHDDQNHQYDLVAVGNCELIFVPRMAFTMMMAMQPEVAKHFGKDDMHRAEAMSAVQGTVFHAAQAFLNEGVEVESLLVINLDRCVRCGNCVRACHARHQFTRLDRRGPIFRRRVAVASTKHEHVMLPSSCRHCRDPECMIGCPTGAIQRFADGDVDINNNCIGCENCARKCPYGNITMRPLEKSEQPSPEVTKRAIKCNLCRGYKYSNCVHECPRGAIMRVDPLRYFDELAAVMDAEQKDAIEWSRGQAKEAGALGTKQAIRRRSTWFIPVSFVAGLAMIAGIIAAIYMAPRPLVGGNRWGLGLGIGAAFCLLAAMTLGMRKRLRNNGLGALEAWTQFHMMFGLVGFIAALAHAGFHVTGAFTTLLLLIFAMEIATGVLGQFIYMRVPSILTRLEREGLARLIEDLYEEQQQLDRSVEELQATLPRELAGPFRKRLDSAAGSIWARFSKKYSTTEQPNIVLKAVALETLPESHRGTAEQISRNVVRLVDVAAQLRLHRWMKGWLVVHVATAAALVVLLAAHIVTALVLLG